ncbi:uncharacterized protein LOC116417957 isoform X2 [Nasonia vitripennis]|uniref:Nuclear receptor domain-containing protein n=1 Tax=Nasonia vitripennis TaxID=7425 RepID=A0A7M7QKB4_NASVI|nr:uncharacterized protein LOC116417957 isoform X2 [Nasonia vitripennis]
MPNHHCQVCKNNRDINILTVRRVICERCIRFSNFNGQVPPCVTGKGKCIIDYRRTNSLCRFCRLKECVRIGLVTLKCKICNNYYEIKRHSTGYMLCKACRYFTIRHKNVQMALRCRTGTNNCILDFFGNQPLCVSCRYNKCVELNIIPNEPDPDIADAENLDLLYRLDEDDAQHDDDDAIISNELEPDIRDEENLDQSSEEDDGQHHDDDARNARNDISEAILDESSDENIDSGDSQESFGNQSFDENHFTEDFMKIIYVLAYVRQLLVNINTINISI